MVSALEHVLNGAAAAPVLFSQGEGEEEETDDLINQVLDEIGIGTSAQVRNQKFIWQPTLDG
jgi:hypothetical protein